MARKRKKKKGWLKLLLFFILTPLIVWSLAFLLWLYWDPIMRPLNKGAKASKTRFTAPAETRGQEQILDDERKQLNEILRKQRDHK